MVITLFLTIVSLIQDFFFNCCHFFGELISIIIEMDTKQHNFSTSFIDYSKNEILLPISQSHLNLEIFKSK